MSNFFVEKEIFQERINICRSCNYYFKPTGNCKRCGCFMRIKASISVMECPEKKWLKVNKIDKVGELPKHLIEEALQIHEGIKTGQAKNQEYKRRAVELYNIIYKTNFNKNSNCSSCLKQVWQGINKIYKKYGEK